MSRESSAVFKDGNLGSFLPRFRVLSAWDLGIPNSFLGDRGKFRRGGKEGRNEKREGN